MSDPSPVSLCFFFGYLFVKKTLLVFQKVGKGLAWPGTLFCRFVMKSCLDSVC